MDSLRLIDILLSIIAGLLGVGWVVLFYSLRKNADEISITAALVISEKDKTAALVLSEKEKAAALVKVEHDKLREEFFSFRLTVAEQYAKTALVKEIVEPLFEELRKIEGLLSSKLDRREFDEHKSEMRRSGDRQ